MFVSRTITMLTGVSSMRRCLNPKNPHKNMSVPSSVTVPADATRSPSDGAEQPSISSLQQEEQVTCQFCKYLLEGALLGDCRVTSWIGSGTFGDVYEAQQLPPLNRRVALKVMAVEHVADGRAAELFAREVQAIAALDHPNILPVLRVGTVVEGRPYLVMKFAAHGSMQKFCPAALQYAHEHGIIHLDVKPANLLLDGEDRLLLADFGVSALLEGYTHASLHGYVGTPLYTAPEQWLEQPRAASDQYALAVTCYQLLTGRAPFTGNLYSIMHGHISTPPPSLRQFQPLIPSEVEEVILQALAKEPTNRYKDMQTFARAYRTAVESSSSSQTDAHEQHYTSEVITQEFERKTGIEEVQTNISTSGQADATPVPVPTLVQQEASNRGVLQTLSQSAIAVDEAVRETSKRGSEQEIEGKLSGEKVDAHKKNWRRSGLLVVLALLLVASSMVGIIWITNP